MKILFYVLLFLLLLAGGCSYTLHSMEGNKITTSRIQEIKLGRTTEMDLFRILGQPTEKISNPTGTISLLYVSTETKSLTLPGRIQLYGFFDKEEEESFEIILQNGVVQNYHFIKR